jgi:predicted RNA-binding Zn-ribbon protein involved in translation (DUF1610 family)
MTGKSHTDEEAKPFALSVMQHMNDKCAEWKAAENIDYSLYGTPLESTTYKFAKCLQKRFGIIKGITDHGYITNSYHVNVREKIDAFTKLKFESEFQRLSPGGAISYVEVPNMQDNLEAVIRVMQFIYDNIMYAELNTKSDYCQVCGYDGEIKIVEDDGKLVWECPNCGNRDQSKLNVARAYLRLHRHAVLEPGPHGRDQGPRAAPVRFCSFRWRSLTLAGTSFSPTEHMTLVAANRSLSQIQYTYPFIRDAIMYMKESDSVIGTTGHMSLELYYDLYLKDSDLSEENLREYLAGQRNSGDMLQIRFSDGSRRLLFSCNTISDYSSSSYSRNNSTIAILVNESLLNQRLLQFQSDPSIQIGVLTEAGDILSQAGDMDGSELTDMAFQERGIFSIYAFRRDKVCGTDRNGK